MKALGVTASEEAGHASSRPYCPSDRTARPHGLMIRCARAALRRLTGYWLLRADPVGYARSIGVRVGSGCRFLGVHWGTFGSEPYLITIGDHVTITAGVQFVNHDGGVWVFREDHPDLDVIAPIHVGNNVFIGVNAILMPGVTIGDNCVIGAGAVVTRDIPAGSVAVGVPARCIKTVDEYWERIRDQAVHVRSLPEREKRRFLEERLQGVRAPR